MLVIIGIIGRRYTTRVCDRGNRRSLGETNTFVEEAREIYII